MTTLAPLVGGESVTRGRELEVTSPYDGSIVGRTYEAGAEEIESAVQAVVSGSAEMRSLKSYQRVDILRRIAQGIRDESEDLARLMALEAGKPIRDARIEVDRAVLTMETAAGEATRMYGETLPLDVLPASADRIGITKRVPIGPVLAITPFNFPLNLVCHKLGPAIAAGNSIFIKPAPKTPLSALALGCIALQSGMPSDGLAVLLCDNQDAQALVEDERFKALSFTGSDTVGWRLKSLAGKKRVILELGGNAGVIVDETADIELAVSRIVAGGFGYAGQSCISVQRTYVHDSIYDRFATMLAARASNLKLGDPLDEATDVGPMINPEAVTRIEEWVQEAESAGATLLTGGRARGPIFEPTVLTEVTPDLRVCRNEVFAPVVSLFRFGHFEEAIEALNDSKYGLQAGIFTRDMPHAMQAFERLEVGGVIVNDIPTFRVDPMPYGGVKDSGFGREGLRYAIHEMTELRLLVLRSGE